MTFDLESFHAQAVQTPSHESVEEMQSLIINTLESAGICPRTDEHGNIIATKGAESGYHLVLNTHLDTVPPHVPYSTADKIPDTDIKGDVVKGRGSCDAKGPLAALLHAFLSSSPIDGKLTIALTPNEETTQAGAAALKGTLDADGVIVGEPTDLDVCHAARGQFEGTVTITGEAAHAAQPDAGRNAIRAVGPIVNAIDSYDTAYGPGSHESLGEPTLTPTVISGGEARNQIPERCVIEFDRRSVPPESADEFEQTFRTHLQAHAPDSVSVTAALADREGPFLEAFSTSPENQLTKTLADSSGGDIRPFGAATEASYFAAHSPTVVFGPGVLADNHGPVAHAQREYVPVSQLHEAARILDEAVARLVGSE